MLTAAELCHWLLENGYAEEREGYGHVSAEVLADALLDNFNIVRKLYD